MTALPQVIAAAKQHASAYRERLAKVRPQDIADRRALIDLPVTRKSELIELQQKAPPFGGFNAVPLGEVARIFASPGPIYEFEARRPDFFRMARALFAAGIRAGAEKVDIGCLKKALVGAEAFPSALRSEFRTRGIGALQCYGTADLGLIAYETTDPRGELCEGMVLDEGIIVELVHPGTGEPV